MVTKLIQFKSEVRRFHSTNRELSLFHGEVNRKSVASASILIDGHLPLDSCWLLSP